MQRDCTLKSGLMFRYNPFYVAVHSVNVLESAHAADDGIDLRHGKKHFHGVKSYVA